MECVNEIVDKVVLRMTPFLDDNQLSQLKNAVRLELCGYEIKETETGLMCLDGNGFNYLEKYKDSLAVTGKSKMTIVNYDLHIRKLLMYLNKNVEDITSDDIIGYLEKYRKFRKVSLSYIGDIRLVFNGFFRFLQKRKVIVYNPVDGVDAVKTKYVIKKPFSAEEMIKIRSSCSNLRDKALIEFMYSSAVRVSELATLNISDVQWRENEIIVLGKGNKERIVYLNPSARYYLEEYINSRTDDNEALFVSLRKPFHRMTKPGIEALCRKIGKRANVEDVHPHRFRRTAATDLLHMGMPIEQVQEFLGHEKIDTTRIYSIVSREQVKSNHRKYMVS